MSEAITVQQLTRKLALLDAAQKRRVYELIEVLSERSRAAGSDSRKHLLLELPVWNEDDVQRIREVQQDINGWQIPT